MVCVLAIGAPALSAAEVPRRVAQLDCRRKSLAFGGDRRGDNAPVSVLELVQEAYAPRPAKKPAVRTPFAKKAAH